MTLIHGEAAEEEEGRGGGMGGRREDVVVEDLSEGGTGLDGMLLVHGGCDPDFNYLNDTWIFNLGMLLLLPSSLFSLLPSLFSFLPSLLLHPSPFSPPSIFLLTFI
jgi:hypothetical protein